MNAILQYCYFKAPLFHYKTLLVHESSIGSSEPHFAEALKDLLN